MSLLLLALHSAMKDLSPSGRKCTAHQSCLQLSYQACSKVPGVTIVLPVRERMCTVVQASDVFSVLLMAVHFQ
jgi:hypothetical protein